MILINKTFERYLPHDEGDDVCEPDESGFLAESEPVTFRELVDLLRYGEPSSWPASGDTREWVTHNDSNDGTRDYYETGARESESIFYSRDNPPRNAKWWRLAFRTAGLLKTGV